MQQQNSIGRQVGSTLIIIGTVIGAGILALPIIAAKLGFILASIVLIVAWAVTTFAAILIADISCSMPYGSSFTSIAKKHLGIFGTIITWITFLMIMYFINIAYISAASSSLSTTFDFLSTSQWSIIFVLVFTVIVLTGIKFVDMVNRFLITMKLIVLILVCFLFVKLVSPSFLLSPPVDTISTAIIAIPVLVTSFTSHVVIPTLSDYLNKNTRDLKRVIIIGSMVPLIIYLIWLVAILGVLPLHGDVSFMKIIFSQKDISSVNVGDILNAINQKLDVSFTKKTLDSFAYISIFTSYLSVSMALYHFNVDSYKLNKFSKFTKYISAVFLTFAIPFIVFQINPNIFIMALRYVGVNIAIVLMIIPVIIILKTPKEKRNYAISSKKTLHTLTVLIALLVIFCVVENNFF